MQAKVENDQAQGKGKQCRAQEVLKRIKTDFEEELNQSKQVVVVDTKTDIVFSGLSSEVAENCFQPPYTAVGASYRGHAIEGEGTAGRRPGCM